MTKIAINEFINPQQLKAELAFTEDEVNKALIEQPAKFAYYATVCYRAEQQVGKIKQILEITRARADSDIRAASQGDDKLTEAGIASRVARQSDVMAATKAYNQAKAVESMAKYAIEAFRHRKDMLIQISMNRREEMKGEIRIMEGRSDPIAARAAGAKALAADLSKRGA